jgi:hypothetical protein
LLASVFGFLARDPVAGTGMGILAGTWGLAGYVTLTSPPGSGSKALGIALLVAGASMLVPAAAATVKPDAAAVMGLAALRFAVTGVYEITASPTWNTVAGMTGLVLAALDYYAAFGFELEDAKRKTVLPLLRSRSGAHRAARRRGRPARRRRPRGRRAEAALAGGPAAHGVGERLHVVACRALHAGPGVSGRRARRGLHRGLDDAGGTSSPNSAVSCEKRVDRRMRAPAGLVIREL